MRLASLDQRTDKERKKSIILINAPNNKFSKISVTDTPYFMYFNISYAIPNFLSLLSQYIIVYRFSIIENIKYYFCLNCLSLLPSNRIEIVILKENQGIFFSITHFIPHSAIGLTNIRSRHSVLFFHYKFETLIIRTKTSN